MEEGNEEYLYGDDAIAGGEEDDGEEDEQQQEQHESDDEEVVMDDDDDTYLAGFQPTNPLHYLRMITQIMRGYVTTFLVVE
jgi:hypothetical protein